MEVFKIMVSVRRLFVIGTLLILDAAIKIIQFPIHNILFEENTKTRSFQSIFLQSAIRHGSEPTLLRITIK